jgi:hypothetical protein
MEAVYDIPWRPSPLRSPSARVAFAVSLLVHATLLANIRIDIPDISRLGEPKADLPLEVRIAPPHVTLPGPAPSPPPAPRVRPRVTVPPPAAPPRAAPPLPPVPATVPVPKAPTGDLSSYIAARQRERVTSEDPVEKPPPAEDANARANRIAAANLAPQQNLTFGFDPSKGGGVFQVTTLTRDYGEFVFYGWNPDMGRRTQQTIEVRRGDASDIRLAMVRKMIEIIRKHQPVEFVWESQRLNRSVTLSSRLRDSSGLEDFMMLEMFDRNR